MQPGSCGVCKAPKTGDWRRAARAGRSRAEESGRDSPREHCGEGPAGVRSSGL